MPAMRATPSTSPFLAPPLRISAAVAGCIDTRARAVAVRSVTGLAPTSTIAAWPRASKCEKSLLSGARQQRARRRRDVRLAHQALAHQEALCSSRGQAPQVGVAADAALGDQEAIGRHQRRQFLRGGKIGDQRLRLRLLMPISGVCSPSARSSSRAIVHLGQHVHIERAGQRLEFARLGVGQCGQDQQDAVGPHRPALVDLPRIEDEVLAQHRQIDRRARGHQVFGGCPGNAARRSAPRGT